MTDPALSSIVAALPDFDPGALPVAVAQKAIASCIRPLGGSETIALDAALGRVLAADVVSPIDVPAHDNSAMDGYAFDGRALSTAALTLRVAGCAHAGHPFDAMLDVGQCVRIMTGAVMPAGSDTVVPQELVQTIGDTIAIPSGAVARGANRRARGEDLAAGKAALNAGRILRPADIGLLASLGIAEVAVRPRLRVAFFSTGDELRSLGEPLDDGCVYDSNRHTLRAMLLRLGCEPLDMGVVRDDPAALEAALRFACDNADAVLTSGGVSGGDADYTKQIVEKLGEIMFWKLAMRPGRPMAFGKLAANGNHAWLFGLPGNPVATMVAFYFFARGALLQLMGADEAPPPLLRAQSQSPIRKRPGRTEYQRGILARGADGMPQVRSTGAQGSGILRSMSEANCMIVLGHEQGDVAAGDMVDVILFDGLC